ncbi:CopL family metal-binding regulatory protein [Flavobacterium sp. MXW15]|uniref:CopL family metal-binding regulatory protein n=1 Tax=Xanthomonas chitinilytica TaxID=2989819 RepID=A0ABT3JSW1_9XANT|nr:CopL family metal-binding regulatory protein [Xanthomonas sp. H13-6]MCW4454351.1 CopL family metal-binding regulatory protein [Flavobacterium sp. MXW15]MCW4471584.1 CopL family metal-binding regulatory protein [Xanthomonas sp. H13-6]
MSHPLPRLLLCLLLIANAIAGAWAATAMAMPMAAQAPTTAEPAGSAPCHGMATDSAGDAASHDRDATPMACSDGQHCDCLQYGSLLLPPVLPLLARIPPATLQPAPAGDHRSPAPRQPVRPPIAA